MGSGSLDKALGRMTQSALSWVSEFYKCFIPTSRSCFGSISTSTTFHLKEFSIFQKSRAGSIGTKYDQTVLQPRFCRRQLQDLSPIISWSWRAIEAWHPLNVSRSSARQTVRGLSLHVSKKSPIALFFTQRETNSSTWPTRYIIKLVSSDEKFYERETFSSGKINNEWTTIEELRTTWQLTKTSLLHMEDAFTSSILSSKGSEFYAPLRSWTPRCQFLEAS